MGMEVRILPRAECVGGETVNAGWELEIEFKLYLTNLVFVDANISVQRDLRNQPKVRILPRPITGG